MQIIVNTEKVREIIKESGFNQTNLAYILEIEPASLVRCLSGKTGLSLNTVVKLADFAKITDIRELLTYKQ